MIIDPSSDGSIPSKTFLALKEALLGVHMFKLRHYKAFIYWVEIFTFSKHYLSMGGVWRLD